MLNGKSSGKKQLADAAEKVITWDVVYHPGELAVKGYEKGTEATQYSLKTASEAYSIKALADKRSFDRNKKQLSHIEIDVVDKNGLPVYNADNEITVKVEGPAKLLGLESGSSVSHEDYKSDKRKVLNGRVLAYIQSQQKTGAVKVTITSPGLQSKLIEF
jgi:hypothetical protein